MIGWFDTFILLFFAIAGVAAQGGSGVENIDGNTGALELYLKDKKDHKEHCSKIEWEQPSIEKYKEDLKSYLPEGCIK